MHDGPDDGPRRSRRSRTDEPSAPTPDGGPTGPDDDVLDRFGLRDSSGSRRAAAARGRGESRPWPPRARRRVAEAPEPEAPETQGRLPAEPFEARTPPTEGRNGSTGHAVDDRGYPGAPDASGPAPEARGWARNGRPDPGRPAAAPGRTPRDERSARAAEPDRAVPRADGSGVAPERTDALPSVPPGQAPDPAETTGRPGGRARIGRPGRRRRSATDSRHTEMMSAVPRRRARDAETPRPEDGFADGEIPDGVPDDGAPDRGRPGPASARAVSSGAASAVGPAPAPPTTDEPGLQDPSALGIRGRNTRRPSSGGGITRGANSGGVRTSNPGTRGRSNGRPGTGDPSTSGPDGDGPGTPEPSVREPNTRQDAGGPSTRVSNTTGTSTGGPDVRGPSAEVPATAPASTRRNAARTTTRASAAPQNGPGDLAGEQNGPAAAVAAPEAPGEVEESAPATTAVRTPTDDVVAGDPTPTRKRTRGGGRPPIEHDDPPPPPTGPGRRLLRIGAALVAVLVFAACASGFSSREAVEGGIRTVAALDPESDAISSRNTQTGDENILVVGLPADRAQVPEAARGDTAVLVHVPAGGAPAVTLELPPTLEVARPPCQRWDGATGSYGETVPAESRTAFSAAYDVGGPKCTVGVVQQMTGLIVTKFVAFDLAGVNALVDSVRGVGVCTERPVIDRALGPVVTRPGNTVLGGSEAERFTAATAVDDTSPASRVQRQQRVLSAVLDSALSTPSLLTPGAADRVARALPGAVTADGAGAGELLVLSRSLSGSTGDDAAPPHLVVPVTDQPNTRGHLELRRSESSELFSALSDHEPVPAEFTVPAQRVAATVLPPGTVVDVLNAAGRPGLAGEIATALRAQGYAIGAVRDAPPTPDSSIRFSPDRSDASGVLAGSVPGARPQADPAATGTLELVLGASFPGPASIAAPALPAGPAADCG